MSSEEVAELAQAIHSHADALYESWTKGGPVAIRRMEDTLDNTIQLLSDNSLQPKLEHLVSTFVRRDKAKRQHHTTNSTTTTTTATSASRHAQSPPPKSQETANNITLSVNGTPKKSLPKSILAVVQRFEPASTPVVPAYNSSTLTSTTSNNNNTNTNNSIISSIHSTLPNSPNIESHSTTGTRMTIAGVGNVSKNIVWAESSNRHTVTEKNLVRHAQPTPNQSQSRMSRSPTISPTKKVRERHIPIERSDEPSNVIISSIISSPSSTITANAATTSTTTTIIPPVVQQQLQQPPQTRVMNLSKIETTQNVSMKNHCPGPKKPGEQIKELELEEERLFQALRTGQIIPPGHHHLPHPIGASLLNSSSFEAFRERASSPLNNSSSRIAFAKERIRQSQEHPLTQQRLELQKRLPSPSSSLAAAIAVQQGKIKFQPPPLNGTLDDDIHVGGHPKENGRQSWVSSMLRFGNGASVADRVQLFEKYPSHIVTPTPPPSPHSVVSTSVTTTTPSSSSSISSASSPSLSPLSSPSLSSIKSSSNNLNNTSNANISNNSHNVSIVNVSMAPKDGIITPSVPKQVSSNTAPWRGIPLSIDNYQPDAVGSTAKKQKQSLKPSHQYNQTVYPPVPRFYFPEGKPPPVEFVQESMSKAEENISKFPPFLNFLHLGQILTAIAIPLYWKKPLWTCLGLKNEDLLDAKRFLKFYRQLISDCPDEATRFLCIMSAASKKKPLSTTTNKRASINDEYTFTDLHNMHLTMTDFIPMMQDIIDTHPGLGFLRDAPEFHSRYITTVISRIFYKVNRSWTGRITLSELRRSNLLRIIRRLEEETDVNLITEYFSYEHFYVIYCKFWELDKDHDLLIDKKDLNSHGDYALSSRIIDRIFDGTVIRGWDVASPVKCTPGKMTYSDFVWFLLSEEDKKTPTAIEYWFRCLDIDGDGILSPYELQFFYQEQESRIESYGIESLDFSNIYCQMIDMLRCSPTGIRLKDLKQNPQLAATVFNTIFNLDKYLDHEQRDPFAASATTGEQQEGESDWDKYAATEYENLIAEESPTDHNMLENTEFDDTSVYASP